MSSQDVTSTYSLHLVDHLCRAYEAAPSLISADRPHKNTSCCGFLPTRISFPVLALVSLGLSITIRRKLFVKFFLESLSHVDQMTMTVALEAKEFTQTMKTNIICILSRFGCRDIPTPQNLEHLLYSQAHDQFKTQPCAALSPSCMKGFQKSINLSGGP